MVNTQPPLQHHLLLAAVAERIAQVPPNTQQNDVGLKMTPLERVLGVHE